MDFKIDPLSPEEHSHFSSLVVGQTTCPVCHQTDVKVANDKGSKGDPIFNYFKNHYPAGSKDLCKGSEKLLLDF